MKISTTLEEPKEQQPKRKREKAKKPEKAPGRQAEGKPKKPEPAPKRRVVTARTNGKPKLTDLGLTRGHNFLSRTEATLTRLYPLTPLGQHKYEVGDTPFAVSAILKLVLKTDQTNPMSTDWTEVLWNVTQRDKVLPPDVSITFTRHFEKVDDALAERQIKRRTNLAILSSSAKKNQKSQSIFVRHDAGLLSAIDQGDCVVAFGAEAILSAPDEKTLEQGLSALQNYLKGNDETRGLAWELDVNHQLQPFLLYGPNASAGNSDVFYQMSSFDAGVASLFVDSGGDRVLGSEYVGISVGKMISSHAAYLLKNARSLIVGNDTVNHTYTLLGEPRTPSEYANLPSQLYWSLCISRAYLLDGQSVTHFVLDDLSHVSGLMEIPLSGENKLALDVARGFLNILEVVGGGDFEDHPERITGRFATHLNNIIALLCQYRDTSRISTTDDFSAVTRSILTDFFVTNKYYAYNPLAHLDDIRLIGNHGQYKTLSDFGAWVAQRKKSNKDRRLEGALGELDIIINETILPTIPALNQKTDPVIDELLLKKYRVIDLTGMSVGAALSDGDATTNVMLISYLNLVLPSLKNGDVLFFHGFSRVLGIAKVIQDMLAGCGTRVDVVFTEGNQSRASKTLSALSDAVDLAVVDLYKNNVEKIAGELKLDSAYAASLTERPGAFYIKTRVSSDYVLLDHIL